MEQYRTVQGYEGLYEVSNYGRVKSLKFGKEKLLKPQADTKGYLFVDLCKDGKVKHHLVHRLVASTFIENPDNLPQVNHKDENKTNNNVENLEWCSHKDNCNYGTRNQRMAEAQRGMTKPWVAEALSIPIDMLTKSGEFIRQFQSAHEAERWLRSNGYPSASNAPINKCCKGRPNFNTAYGFKWCYAQGN